MHRPLVVGNWKMHGSRPANAELLAALLAARPFAADVAVCVPYVYLHETAAALAGSELRWGAQDVSEHAQGAYTGEISAAMLAECGCRYVLVGHSERRAGHAESDMLVARKAQVALARGVTPIVCVGETLAERDAGHTEAVVKRQLSTVIHQLAHCAAEMVVAYEPVWAIGSG
ncbi:MAG: triose-phosphate isomerase, partial [Burkholderiales bacterium]|nr:triose-phosphate isomerase [Burkholderiales bacterium]